MSSLSRSRLRRLSAVISALAAVWAMIVSATGGFAVQIGALRFSSRRPGAAAAVALLGGVTAWLLSPPEARRRALIAEWTSLLRMVDRLPSRIRHPPAVTAPIAAAALSIFVVFLGMVKGAPIAGGADSYGYVSEAHLWAAGTLRLEQPLLREIDGPFVAEALSPLGYRPALDRLSIVPVYSPGLPLAMAAFERVAGREAVFYVVPLLGGVAVWATYLMGVRLAGRAVGLIAAILLATSPTFLFQLMFPMSDVPVAAWWALALALLTVPRRDAALLAGISAGMAVLTRPNLVLLVAACGAPLAWEALRRRSMDATPMQRLLLFSSCVIAACLIVAGLNAYWYGSPLKSGYGSFSDLYRVENLWPNLARYSRWLLESQTPAVALAILAPFVVARHAEGARFDGVPRTTVRWWWAFIAVTFLCYLFYAPFDAWWYLRFLLPAFPPLLVLMSVGLTGLARRMPQGTRSIATAIVVSLLAAHGVRYAVERGVLGFREGERKYAAVGKFIAQRLPESAVVVSLQHSGSVRYYSNRLTLRYDWVPADRLDALLDDFRRHGYAPYFVFEEWERDEFRARFKGQSVLANLDWPPLAQLRHASKVSIYDPAQRDASATGDRKIPEVID